MQPEPVTRSGSWPQQPRRRRGSLQVVPGDGPETRSVTTRCRSGPGVQSDLHAAATAYIHEARRILGSSAAPSVNVALERKHPGGDLEAALQRLIELVGVDGGDYMFVLVEQGSRLAIERPLRLTDYPERTTSSVWSGPLRHPR